MKNILSAVSVLALIGCSAQTGFQNQRWSSTTSGKFSGYGESQAVVKKLKQDVKTESIGGLQVVRTPQLVDGKIPIEGTWFQEVRSKTGDVQSYNYNFADSLPDDVLAAARELYKNKEKTLRLAKKSYLLLKQSPSIISSNVVIDTNGLSPQAWLKVVFMTTDELSVMTYYFNAAARVKKTVSYSHDFTNGVGYVFDASPAESEITLHQLNDLKGDGTLGSRHLSVESVVKPTPVSEDHVFKINASDQEFDLLQSYFFVDQTIRWFQQQIDTTLGYPLNIKVHIGGLTPTNAAFFYAGNIRLGEGDGISYQKIPRDPSIVSHEAGHAFVEKLSGLGFEGEAGSYSEAFSDFFTAARLGRAEMAYYSYLKGPYKRTLDNDFRADRDLKGKKYNDSLVISGTFWDLKKILGTEKSVQLAKEFLIELGPGGKILDLPEVLRSVAKRKLPSEDQHVIESVLHQRGWIQ